MTGRQWMKRYFDAWAAPWFAWMALSFLACSNAPNLPLLVVLACLEIAGCIHIGRMAIAYQRAQLLPHPEKREEERHDHD